jgi:excisionase family DNA binding protein
MNALALPTLLPVSDVAEHLGVAKRTIYVLVAKGELGSCRVGRRLLIPATELDAFVRRRIRPARAQR